MTFALLGLSGELSKVERVTNRATIRRGSPKWRWGWMRLKCAEGGLSTIVCKGEGAGVQRSRGRGLARESSRTETRELTRWVS